MKIWHSSTYRLETTLNYGLERVWSIAHQRGSNDVAIGYDEGSVMIKVGGVSNISQVYVCHGSGSYTKILIMNININRDESNTVYAEIFARRKFSPISPSALIGEIFIVQIFCPVLMITLRVWQPLPHWRKFIPPNISAIQR